MSKTFDVIVIGSGSAVSPAMRCREAGWEVAVIDSRPHGGTCALRGCDPKKVLVRAAEAVEQVRRWRARAFDPIRSALTGRSSCDSRAPLSSLFPKAGGGASRKLALRHSTATPVSQMLLLCRSAARYWRRGMSSSLREQSRWISESPVENI